MRQPNGTFVAGLFVSGRRGSVDMFTLPVTGTYTITVDPRDQNTGALTFLLDAVPENTGTTAIGTPTTVTIGTVGENAVRTFAATAGQRLTLSVSGNTIAGVDLVVRQPNGSPWRSLFLSGATGFRDMFTLPVDGHVHDHGRPARPEHRVAHVLLGAVPRQHRARPRSARRRR